MKTRILHIIRAASVAIMITIGGKIYAQNISEIAKSDPLIITGSIGTQNTFYHSSQGGMNTSSWNNSVYANLNFQVFSFNMPFSFTLNNAGTGWSYPQFDFNLTPTWNGWTLHAGRHTIPFSNYVYNVPVNGVGVEYTKHNLRFGAFYGTIRKSINDDPLDPTARQPQFQRKGFGFKMGYGTSSNYLDLYIFRAKDIIGSVDEHWYDAISPQENLVVGAKGRVAYKRMSLTANIASSIFTSDMNSKEVDKEAIGGSWDKLFDAKLSTYYRFAGDVNLSWSIKNFVLGGNYKLIQPDYQTLGTNYISNNVQSYGAVVSGSLFRSRVSLNGNFNIQQDNVTKRQLYTTSGYVYNAGLNWNINDHWNASANYNGYRQRQSDGTEHVNDTTRVDRQMHGLTTALNYSTMTGDLGHNVGVSYNLSRNIDLNRFATGESDVDTHAAGVNYGLSVPQIGMSFSLAYNYQLSKDYYSTFSTNMISFGTGRAFLKERNLNLNANVNYSINSNDGNRANSFGASLSSSYVLAKKHNFSLVGSYNHFANTNERLGSTLVGENYSVSLNYNYAFTLFEWKRKAKEPENP